MTSITGSIVRAAAVATALAVSMPEPTSAITVELAKKCRDLAIKSHPPAVAGSRTGTAEAEREFYRACVAKGGNVTSDDVKK